MMEALLIADYLDCVHPTGPEVVAFEHLTKATLAHDRQDLVSIGKMVMRDYNVIPSVVVIAKVAFGQLLIAFNLWGTTTADKEHLKQNKETQHIMFRRSLCDPPS